MSFAFGFNENDLDGDEPSQGVPAASTSSQWGSETVVPKIVDIDPILSLLVDIMVSVEKAASPSNNVVYKRALYDIKHQVMTENDEQLEKLLLAEGTDLKKNSYEGGFKVWECSFDLIDKLGIEAVPYRSIIEIGSGTSLPSCFLLYNKFKSGDKLSLDLVLSDFNYDVLRLVTVPNVFINWFVARHGEQGEFRVTKELVDEFKHDLVQFNVNLRFVSGSWGKTFLGLVSDISYDLMLSCETIYSSETLPVLGNVVVELVKKSQGLALIGAKNYYFGVGGSVSEFVTYVERDTGVEVRCEEMNSSLKRSIVEIRAARE